MIAFDGGFGASCIGSDFVLRGHPQKFAPNPADGGFLQSSSHIYDSALRTEYLSRIPEVLSSGQP